MEKEAYCDLKRNYKGQVTDLKSKGIEEALGF